MTVVLIVIN